MKTLVVIEIPGAILSLPLSDLTSVPSEGRFYVFEGVRYEVKEVTEFLGFRGRDGKEIGANTKLLELLTAVYGDAMKAMAMMAKLKNIGSADLEVSATSAGGIIMPGHSPVKTDFDTALFVRALPVKSDAIVPPIKLSSLAATGDSDQLTPDGDAKEGAGIEG
ncbi:MAG: hypothetical protein K2X77_14245 [Candidatus Obscuribacterales bacterium]|jgi:hypothetical protein|nr:hypothetical protein [Candidatus Obscuribacterales bacterium]